MFKKPLGVIPTPSLRTGRVKEDLVNHLTYKMVKGKVKLKWTGSLRELKGFVVLLLEKDGHWHIGIQDNKVGSKSTYLIM